MKKLTGIILTALVIVGSVFAGIDDIEGSFSATGNGAGVGISRDNGFIQNVAFIADLDTNKTVVVHRPQAGTSMAAASSSTTVTVYTATSNVIEGVTATTDDFLIFETSSGLLLRQISTVSTHSSGVQTYVMAASTTAAAGDKVYLADDGDKVSLPLTTSGIDSRYLFTGYRSRPVYIKCATGSGPNTIISGTYSVKR
jgi:hypothetical protein